MGGVGADVQAIGALLALAMSNGWLMTAIFVHAPASVGHADRQAAGALLTLWLNVGLMCGSFGSNLVVRWSL